MHVIFNSQFLIDFPASLSAAHHWPHSRAGAAAVAALAAGAAGRGQPGRERLSPENADK